MYNTIYDTVNEYAMILDPLAQIRLGNVRSAAGKLNPELDPIPRDPAAGDYSYTVEMGHRTGSKDSRENTPDIPPDTMQSEAIQSIIALHEKLEFGRKITNRGSDNPNDHRRPNRDITAGGCDTDKASESSGRPGNGRPMPHEIKVHKDPCEGSGRSRKIGVCSSIRRSQTRIEGTPTVESEPPEPEKDNSKDDHGGVVRAECRNLFGDLASRITASTEDKRVS